MPVHRDRYACLSDLENYFRKWDYLGGLTTPEKAKIRENIGVSEFGQEAPVEVTYEKLLGMVESNAVSIGASYIITDFQTIYTSNVIDKGIAVSGGLGKHTTATSPIYQLLVTGIDKNRLASKAYVLDKDWEIEYDIEQKILEDGEKTKGKITWMKDSNGNSAYYDFKSIKFRRTAEDLRDTEVNIERSYIDLYTFSTIQEDGKVLDASLSANVRHNELKEGCTNNVFLGTTKNNIFEPECEKNTFINGCIDCHFLWKTTNNIFNEAVRYLSGTINNKKLIDTFSAKEFKMGEFDVATTITKTIHKVNEATIISFLDPITYTHQIIIL